MFHKSHDSNTWGRPCRGVCFQQWQAQTRIFSLPFTCFGHNFKRKNRGGGVFSSTCPNSQSIGCCNIFDRATMLFPHYEIVLTLALSLPFISQGALSPGTCQDNIKFNAGKGLCSTYSLGGINYRADSRTCENDYDNKKKD